MSNSIDINLERGNNSMNSLSFHWSAIFKDGTIINQFNENGTENMFQLVKDKFNELSYFNLTNKKGKLFTVDLKNAFIGYNYLAFPYAKRKEKKENIRLIFFRRHRVEITENLIEKSHIITYYLGYQYLDKLGNNRKIILEIESDGTFILGG